MPAYPWLFDTLVDDSHIQTKMRALRSLGVPYTDEQITGAVQSLSGISEAEALVRYLQSLGMDMRNFGESQ